MKKYKLADIYILTVAKVTDYSYPNWFERITHSIIDNNRVIAAMVYDNKICKTVYVTGTGVKIYTCSGDTKYPGDLFVKNRIALGITKAASKLPNKLTVQWMNDFQAYLQKEQYKASNTKYIESILIEKVIQTIEEYITEPVEKLQLPRAAGKNFSLGQIDAYENCLKLLRELVKEDDKNETANKT